MWRDIAGNQYRIAAQESANLKTAPRRARADALSAIAFSPFQGRKLPLWRLIYGNAWGVSTVISVEQSVIKTFAF
jgi:hypothetical protein